MALGEEDQVDKRTKAIKELSLVRNIHNLSPNIQTNSDADGINIVNALKSSGLIIEVAMQLEGFFYDASIKKWAKYREPVMNQEGRGNFLSDISVISQTIEFSSFKEKEIPKLVSHLFKMNYPFYTIYADEYELRKSDFNLIATILFSFILSAFKKAQGSGHRNVIRGTYSEDLLGKYVPVGYSPENNKEKSSGGFLSMLNPFRKARGAV